MSAPFSAKNAAPPAPIPYAINENVDIKDADKVSKAWKSSDLFPKIDPFLGDTDPRGIRQFYSLVTTTQSYRFANAAEQYFFVYRCLDGEPSRLVDKHMKHYHISQTFSGLLKEMWRVLYDEYSSSADYSQVRRRLMDIRMASGDYGAIISRYEDFCDESINLAEQSLDDDDLINNPNINLNMNNSLTPEEVRELDSIEEVDYDKINEFIAGISEEEIVQGLNFRLQLKATLGAT
ncbi:hypothetical protein FOL47_009780 [Perkinsus chesapeaki]|uniref:Uncharacterized protein n=1 Tax=Perkinsus chesapeaki TaxID=330153 RepID=A0A7J6L6D9_PERCH|nr:hypothetical protein FOL47_009780 [Perkinsus chesapeaki]